jgi:hypothetical protein
MVDIYMLVVDCGYVPTTELSLRDAANVARVNFILLASLKITSGPTLKDLDPDSIRINDLE